MTRAPRHPLPLMIVAGVLAGVAIIRAAVFPRWTRVALNP